MSDPLISWQPTDVVVLTNAGEEHLLLELPSGPQRLDKGRTMRITASALKVPQIKQWVDAGKIHVEKWKK